MRASLPFSWSSNPYPSQYLIIWPHLATVPAAVRPLQISTIPVSPDPLHLNCTFQMTVIVQTLGLGYFKILKRNYIMGWLMGYTCSDFRPKKLLNQLLRMESSYWFASIWSFNWILLFLCVSTIKRLWCNIYRKLSSLQLDYKPCQVWDRWPFIHLLPLILNINRFRLVHMN